MDYDNMEPSSDDPQDDQHAQKYNSQIEVLTDRIAELQKQLDDEKAENQRLVSEIEERERNEKEKNHHAFLEKHHDREMKKMKEIIDQLKKRVTDAEFGPSMIIRNEIMKICSKNSIVLDVSSASELSDEKCLGTLRSIHKILKSCRMAPTDSKLTGNESDNELVNRIKNLESELRLALGAAEDIKALKAKLLQVVERLRLEKESKLKVEQDMNGMKKKLEMLSDHIEKLMIHLKHEAASKVRTMEQLRVSEREVIRVKDKCEMAVRKSNAKDRLIVELREGSKVLEDQLRLMDEKYLELRAKLDWARDNGARRVKQAERTASELRMKFALAGGNNSLDSIPLPNIFQGMSLSNETAQDSFFPGSFPEGMLATPQLGGGQNSSKMSRKKKRSKTTMGGHPELNIQPEPTMDNVLEKLRLQEGKKRDWSEEKVRDLVRPDFLKTS